MLTYITWLSRVTTIEGLYITDLCEKKNSVDQKVVKEMETLRTENNMKLCFTPYTSTVISIFSETRFSPLDPDDMYNINGYTLFRNDSSDSSGSGRPYDGTAVYSRILLKDGYPFAHNIDGVEFIIVKTDPRYN